MGATGSRPFGRRVTQQLPENVKKVKIVLVGDSQVGKTRLFHGLLSRPMPTEGVPTTAANIGAKLVHLENEAPVLVELWDVPHHVYTGSSMQKQYLRDVQACILVFSASRPGSWRTALRYLEAMNWSPDAHDRVPVFVCEIRDDDTHIDRPAPELAAGITDASQDELQAQQWANTHGVLFLRGLLHAALLKTVLCTLSTTKIRHVMHFHRSDLGYFPSLPIRIMDAPPPLELKQHGRSATKLKHKSKNKRTQSPSSAVGMVTSPSPSAADRKPHGRSTPKHSAEDAMRELLSGKIAELEVGGEENLETPIDLSGIYQDAKLCEDTLAARDAVLNDEALSADEKLAFLATQIAKQLQSENMGLLQKKIGEMNAKCILLRQRKQAVSTELGKTNGAKSKLEKLCRELQKQNKLIVTESRRIADEEDQKRRELSSQFQKTIEEVSTKMDQQGKDYVASLRENENLQQKLKGFLEQYAARDEHFQRQLEAKDLTTQLAEAKLQHQIELTARESDKVKLALEKATEFSEREMQLQTQLNSYSEKFDVVQETLAKSNQMFGTFREEMDKMAKHTKKIEKENLALNKKCAMYDNSAIASIQEKVKSAEETQKLLEKIKKLESLCRLLQAERNSARQVATGTE